MKKDIHPTSYRPVIFVDVTNGAMFLVNSTIPTSKKAKYTDGKEYDMHEIEISSATHPFWTGAKDASLDTAGRIEKFRTRQVKAKK